MSKKQFKTKPRAKFKTPEPSRLRVSRNVASEMMGGRSDRYFDRLEARGELTPISLKGQIYYFIDEFRAAVLQPGSKLSLELADLKRRAENGEVLSIANNTKSVMLDGLPLTAADFKKAAMR
ncbi:MAG TPA: hypothetical protein VMT08_19955 [Bradyrhizobium sp.]|nr:hypothetical protein [Bradyrhizobium sp.]